MLLRKPEERTLIKNYIVFLQQRIFYIKRNILIVSTNEFQYLQELYKNILNYKNTHIIFFAYLFQKFDNYKLQKLLGFDSDRGMFHWLKRERTKLIDFITEQETIAFAKYPFVNNGQYLNFIKEVE